MLCVLALAIVGVVLSGCCPKRVTVKTVAIPRSCLSDLGPAPSVPTKLGTDDHTTDPSCNEKFEICATADATGKIVTYIAQAKRWIRDAETQCQAERDPP